MNSSIIVLAYIKNNLRLKKKNAVFLNPLKKAFNLQGEKSVTLKCPLYSSNDFKII